MTLKHVIDACNEANKPVTVCGEMAGKPKAFVLLLGMGLRRFSMSPAFVPSIKELAKQVTLHDSEQILNSVMKFKTTSQVNKFMTRQLEQIAPNLAMLDTV